MRPQGRRIEVDRRPWPICPCSLQVYHPIFLEVSVTTLDAVLEKFDASKAKVRKEIREGFFREDGTLSI